MSVILTGGFFICRVVNILEPLIQKGIPVSRYFNIFLRSLSNHIYKEVSEALEPDWLIAAGAYPGFCGIYKHCRYNLQLPHTSALDLLTGHLFWSHLSLFARFLSAGNIQRRERSGKWIVKHFKVIFKGVSQLQNHVLRYLGISFQYFPRGVERFYRWKRDDIL